MKSLYQKFMLIVGGGYLAIVLAVLIFVYTTESREIEKEGLAQAQALNQVAFEALYASMRQGGGRKGNREVIARLQELGEFTSLRVVKGQPVIQQFGAEPDELPQDELDRRALSGKQVQEVRREDGYRIVRHVTPLFVRSECQRCHQVPVGAVNGVISAEISLQEVEAGLRTKRNILLGSTGGGLLILGLITFYAFRKLVILPLQDIQRGAVAIAQGDLNYRLEMDSGGEVNALAEEFNRMAHRLQETHGWETTELGKGEAAIEASRDAIWVSDSHRQIVMVNSALERMTGKPRHELLGQTCRYLFGVRTFEGPSLCDSKCPFLETEDDDGVDCGGIEGVMPTVGGEEAWIEISYGRVRHPEDDHLAGVVHIVHDLTQRKEIEQLKDHFISMVSHELRTPLHHIKGFATSLLQTDVSWDAATQRDFLESINEESDRLTKLVDKILQLSRLEAGNLPMEKDWYTPDDLVDKAVARLHCPDNDLKLCQQITPDLPALYVDGHDIEIVLGNLIENAVKYSPPESSITIEVDQQDGQLVFCVADQGVGIPEDHQGDIFDRFYRINGQMPNVSGTGLGLAICKRIVEAHHGNIWVDSKIGQGSRFYFSLPM